MKSSKVARASGIPVFCAHTKIVPALSLKGHPKNPKIHPARQLDRYQRVIAGAGTNPKGNGWRRAIVISARSGFIVKGHGAWQMAVRREWDVPVEIQAYKSDAEEIRDLLADNRLAELGETDDEKLAAVLRELDASEIPLSGFDETDLAKLLKEEPRKFEAIGASFEVIIECADESAQKKIFEKLSKEGLKCRVLTL